MKPGKYLKDHLNKNVDMEVVDSISSTGRLFSAFKGQFLKHKIFYQLDEFLSNTNVLILIMDFNIQEQENTASYRNEVPMKGRRIW